MSAAEALPASSSTLPAVAERQAAVELAPPREELPTRAQLEHNYRMLAATLVTNESAWTAYYARCEAIVETKLYGHKHANTVAIAGLKGMAMGLDLMRALATVKVIHGTPTIRGPSALALIRERCPDAKIECTESTAERCSWQMKRPGGKETTFSREINDIPAAQRNRNDLWDRYPKRLLKWDCASEGFQELFGDVLEGCYVTEEIEGARGEDLEEPSPPDDKPPARHQDRPSFARLLAEYAKAKSALHGGDGREIQKAAYHELCAGIECSAAAPTEADVGRMAHTLESQLAELVAQMEEAGRLGHAE